MRLLGLPFSPVRSGPAHETGKSVETVPRANGFRSPVEPAFTLIELLMTISIISILLTMLIPMLVRARRSAGHVTCQSNMRQQGVGLAMYQASHRGFVMPAAESRDIFPIGHPEYESFRWHTLIDRTITGRPTISWTTGVNPMWACPLAKPTAYAQMKNSEPTTYNDNGYAANAGLWHTGSTSFRENEIRRPAEMVYVVEFLSSLGLGTLSIPGSWYAPIVDSNRFFGHYGGANFLMTDGSIRQVRRFTQEYDMADPGVVSATQNGDIHPIYAADPATRNPWWSPTSQN